VHYRVAHQHLLSLSCRSTGAVEPNLMDNGDNERHLP
jgi:hypothetical protein